MTYEQERLKKQKKTILSEMVRFGIELDESDKEKIMACHTIEEVDTIYADPLFEQNFMNSKNAFHVEIEEAGIQKVYIGNGMYGWVYNDKKYTEPDKLQEELDLTEDQAYKLFD